MGSVTELEATRPWVVSGTERGDSRPVALTVNAATEEAATEQGRRLGIVVTSVRPVGERPKAAGVTESPGTTRRKGDGFLWFWLVSAFLTIIIGQIGQSRMQAARDDGMGGLSSPAGVGSSDHSVGGLLGSLIAIAAISALPAGVACMIWNEVRQRPASGAATRPTEPQEPPGSIHPPSHGPSVATAFRKWPKWKLAVAAGAFVFLVTGLFPPHVYRYSNGRQVYAGYGFIFSPPTPRYGSSVEIDSARLAVEWVVVAVVTVVAASLLRPETQLPAPPPPTGRVT